MFKLLMTRRDFLGSGGGFRARHDWQIACTTRFYCLVCGLFWGWPCNMKYMATKSWILSHQHCKCVLHVTVCLPLFPLGSQAWPSPQEASFEWCWTFHPTAEHLLLPPQDLHSFCDLHDEVILNSIVHRLHFLPLTTWKTMDGHLLTLTCSWPFKLLLNVFLAGVPLQTWRLHKENEWAKIIATNAHHLLLS